VNRLIILPNQDAKQQKKEKQTRDTIS
jgi:hypothetical protein